MKKIRKYKDLKKEYLKTSQQRSKMKKDDLYQASHHKDQTFLNPNPKKKVVLKSKPK